MYLLHLLVQEILLLHNLLQAGLGFFPGWRMTLCQRIQNAHLLMFLGAFRRRKILEKAL